MKNIKRLLVIILVMALCASLFSVAYAKHDKGEDKDDETQKVLSADVLTLKTLGLLVGSGKDGVTLEYSKSKPTRVQGFIIYLRLINQEVNLNQFNYHHGDKNFDDHHGHSDFVQKGMAFAKAHPEFNWVGSNGKFNPMAHLTAREYAKIMLTALGYEYNADFYWNNVESFAEGLGLNVPEGKFSFEELATMTVQTLYMAMKTTDTKLIDYLASINPEFAAKVALLENTTTPDTLKPTVTDLVLSASYVAGPPSVNGQVILYFSEAMKADSLTNLANFAVDLDGSAAVYTSTQLSLMAGAAAVVSADKKSVTLTIPGSALNGGTAAGAGITDITISGLTDQAGNTLDPVTQFVRKAANLTVTLSAAIDVNKLQVTFNNPMKTIDSTEFKLYRSDGTTLASVGTSCVLDASGKIVTVTLGGSLTATARTIDSDLTTAKLAIGTATTRDIFGNAVSGTVAVPVVNATTPATVTILDKIIPSVASLVKGTAAYTFEMTYTEPVNAVDQATLTAALKITNLSGVAQTAAYLFSGSGGTINDFTKLTAIINDGSADKYNIELLGQGIRDAAGNIVKAFAKTTLTVQTSDQPVITARETQDLDKDGYLDAIKLTFNKNINDSSVNANSFDVAGFNFETFNPTAAGDVANNNVIYITFPESSAADTGATPTIAYTQGTLEDSAGNKLASTGAIMTTDKAAPVVMSALPIGTLTAGSATSSAALVLSEDITAANQQAVLTAVQAHSTMNDLVTVGDIVTTYVWTTNKLLTVSVTANANGGVNPDNIVLTAAAVDLIDAAGNTAAAAQVIK